MVASQTYGVVYGGRARQHRRGRRGRGAHSHAEGQPTPPQVTALCHAIVALADKAVTLGRSGDKLCEGASGGGDAPGGGSDDAGLGELLVLTHGAVLNVSNQARVSTGGADANNVSVSKMVFGYGAAKSNDRLKHTMSTGCDNSQWGDTSAG